jgi:hypothetical protein
VTTPAAPRARKPDAPPSKADLAERDRYAKRAAESLDGVRASAQTWRTGLTAFITIVTTGVVITGRTTTADMAPGWRTLVTVLIGGGLLLAVIGLWQALAAEAGTDPKARTLQNIRADYGTLDAYDVHLAETAARRLEWGRRAVAAAVFFLLAGIATTWWAPAAEPAPPAHLKVAHDGVSTCGTLKSADGGQVRLTLTGTHEPVVIPLTHVTNLALTTSCP